MFKKIFFFLNKINLINTDELLLDAFKEKGIIKIIKDYKEDLEDIQKRINHDQFTINKSRKNIKTIKSKIKETTWSNYRDHANAKPELSYNLDISIGSNYLSIRYWQKKIKIYQDLLHNSVHNFGVCKNRSKIRFKINESWYNVAKQWNQLADEYLQLSKKIRQKLEYYEEKQDIINHIRSSQIRVNMNYCTF